MIRNDLAQAAAAWDTSKETLDDVNRRIHDGVPIEQLTARADGIISTVDSLFEIQNLDISSILEIGSGVGFLMEAIERRTQNHRHRKEIVGLDISDTMITSARQRLKENPAYKSGLFQFAKYDGVTMPFDNDRFDFVYSIATLQHIPKPYVYNLFFEIKRILKDTGSAILQFLPFSLLPQQEKIWPWEKEIKQQIGLIPPSHWHHFYSEEELQFVLKQGSGFQFVRIVQNNANIWAHVFKRAPAHK
jgi:ubiquinone/menaquinone biosynthesis C-methylase UbiE